MIGEQKAPTGASSEDKSYDGSRHGRECHRLAMPLPVSTPSTLSGSHANPTLALGSYCTHVSPTLTRAIFDSELVPVCFGGPSLSDASEEHD